jgi:thiol-disulfide isomerase/thioredoxin
MKTLAASVLWFWSLVAVAAGPALVNLEGAEDAVSKHIGKGQWTLVIVWSTACHICQHETPTISAYHQNNKGGRIKVMGVAINGYQRKDAITAFREEYSMQFPTLVADPAQYLRMYKTETGKGFRGTPTFLPYDREGNLTGLNLGALDVAALDKFLDAKEG